MYIFSVMVDKNLKKTIICGLRQDENHRHTLLSIHKKLAPLNWNIGMQKMAKLVSMCRFFHQDILILHGRINVLVLQNLFENIDADGAFDVCITYTIFDFC